MSTSAIVLYTVGSRQFHQVDAMNVGGQVREQVPPIRKQTYTLRSSSTSGSSNFLTGHDDLWVLPGVTILVLDRIAHSQAQSIGRRDLRSQSRTPLAFAQRLASRFPRPSILWTR